MSDQPIKLDSLSANELDAIREVASIGSGHSVSALSDLLGKNIQMEVPNGSSKCSRCTYGIRCVFFTG